VNGDGWSKGQLLEIEARSGISRPWDAGKLQSWCGFPLPGGRSNDLTVEDWFSEGFPTNYTRSGAPCSPSKLALSAGNCACIGSASRWIRRLTTCSFF
jgi:hypothetical protein